MDRSSGLLAIVIGVGLGLAAPAYGAGTPLQDAQKPAKAQTKASAKKKKAPKSEDSNKASASDPGSEKGKQPAGK